MRMQRYLLAECLVLGLALFGVVAAGRWVIHMARAPRHAKPSLMASELPGSAGVFPLHVDSPALPNPQSVAESSGTFLGMEDEFLITRMRLDPIARIKFNRGGSSLSFRVDFADGARAAFKPAQTNLQTIPRREVAAYQLNRLLGLSAVPPATPRLVSRDELFGHLHPDTLPMLRRIRAETIFNPRGYTAGVMMYWVPIIKDSGLDTPAGIAETTQWLSHGSAIPAAKHALAAQLSDLIVFDFLTSNPDRYSGGNLLTNADGTRLLFMDNTMSFFIEPQGSEKTRAALARTQRFSWRLYQALDRISEESLAKVLAQASEGEYEILTLPEIRAVVARRDYLKNYVAGLVASFGRLAVFYFP